MLRRIVKSFWRETITAERLLGRGAGGGNGAPQEIALGTNLSLSGTTLNAAGGGGGLTWGSTYVADSGNKAFTLTVGAVTPVDLSNGTLDGNVVVTLPSPGTPGRRCGVVVIAKATVAGSFPIAPGYCLELVNATSVNGESYTAQSTGSGKFGSWDVGERLVFVDTGSTWLLELDGRKPQPVMLYLAATESPGTAASNAWTIVPHDSYDFDPAGLRDLANNRINVKRTNQYSVSAVTTLNESADQGTVFSRIATDPGGTPSELVRSPKQQTSNSGSAGSPASDDAGSAVIGLSPTLSAGDLVGIEGYHTMGFTAEYSGNATNRTSFFQLVEQL